MEEEVNYTRIAIPRDPQSDHTTFLTGMPYCLQRQITADEWKIIIQGLNEVIKEKDAPSPLNVLKFLLFIPILIDTSSYDSAVENYLRDVNINLSPSKIFIAHPMLNGYTELEVRYLGIVESLNENN